VKSFPVFVRFDVNGYGLYPGPGGASKGLHVNVRPGLTLIVGANGLGKTTLITLLFRLLTGPFDIPQLGAGDELGFRRLAATAIPAHLRGIFSRRVSDRAANATANVEFLLGKTRVCIERRLDNLAIVKALVGDKEPQDEAAFQTEIATAAGLGSFGDFILMLRYLVFYFEDRRALVWDPSAQRQLLRMLFLPADLAQRWTAMERSVLENDSRMRNFQAVVGREERTLTAALAKVTDSVPLRAELQALEALQDAALPRLEELEGYTDELDKRRQEARLSNLTAKQDREARFRALEHAKLLAIEARFPGRLETGRYMVAHLMSELDCLVCGTHAPQAAQVYADRLSGARCVVCDSDLSKSGQIVEAREVADERVAKAQRELDRTDRELAATTRERDVAETEFDAHIAEATRLRSEIATRSARLTQIVQSLPPDEAVLRQQRAELAAIRGRLETMREELIKERAAFKEFVEQCTNDLLSKSTEIVTAFEQFAGKFLSERVSLTWTSRNAMVGQSGEAIPFPAFELNMTGSDFTDTIRRAGPDDVSESQREFIDLAFRMALMRSAGQGSSGLVIDTPESSLDTVFAKRAGEVLLRFGTEANNTLVVTSNLVEGSLLPALVAGIASTPEKAERVVDLFEIAKPTAAVEADREEYDRLRASVFKVLA
jgi:energy-coupling factor transporter ATP-binding protein EcfA2